MGKLTTKFDAQDFENSILPTEIDLVGFIFRVVPDNGVSISFGATPQGPHILADSRAGAIYNNTIIAEKIYFNKAGLFFYLKNGQPVITGENQSINPLAGNPNVDVEFHPGGGGRNEEPLFDFAFIIKQELLLLALTSDFIYASGGRLTLGESVLGIANKPYFSIKVEGDLNLVIGNNNALWNYLVQSAGGRIVGNEPFIMSSPCPPGWHWPNMTLSTPMTVARKYAMRPVNKFDKLKPHEQRAKLMDRALTIAINWNKLIKNIDDYRGKRNAKNNAFALQENISKDVKKRKRKRKTKRQREIG